ncbi:MAG: hypothetical protein NC131_13040 [Roseburia sp.]|nr:hypothetical protein [Roseburia sp.]
MNNKKTEYLSTNPKDNQIGIKSEKIRHMIGGEPHAIIRYGMFMALALIFIVFIGMSFIIIPNEKGFNLLEYLVQAICQN